MNIMKQMIQHIGTIVVYIVFTNIFCNNRNLMAEKPDDLGHNLHSNDILYITDENDIQNFGDKNSLNTDTEKAAAELNADQGTIRPSWDPFCSHEWDRETASSFCIRRLKRDLASIFSEAPPLIYLVPEEDDITKLHAIISGPANTPYEGGLFNFFLRVPPQYPFQPPKVRLMTTGNGNVRFNPNFYKNGKVCLSILGTWSGPSWTASQSLLSVLLSIQSLMNENPYFNEPGYHEEVCPGDSKRYNDCITHETLRVAVCDFMESRLSKLPSSLKDIIEKSFLAYVEHYRDIIKKFDYLDGDFLMDPHNCNQGVFQFKKLQERIDIISERLQKIHS